MSIVNVRFPTPIYTTSSFVACERGMVNFNNLTPGNLTPAMHQYVAVKRKHPDCIVLFRMGDFYETFYDDAKVCAKELEITLTGRGKDEKRAPLAGIPYHALDQYLAKLIKKGYKVAICEQLEDPKKAKGIVKRDVVRIVTPGTVIESNLLDAKTNNYIVSLYPHDGQCGIACMDISTGEFTVFSTTETQLLPELAKLHPAECLIPASYGVNAELQKNGLCLQALSDVFFSLEHTNSLLCSHFRVASPEGIGLNDPLLIQAAGGLLQYVMDTQKCSLAHVRKISHVQRGEYMYLDASTVRNLELFSTIRNGEHQGTVHDVLDKTQTSMGARLLRRWILYPLLSPEKINERLASVEELLNKHAVFHELGQVLRHVHDIERLVCRITYGTALPRDILSLSESLSAMPAISHALAETTTPLLHSFLTLHQCTHITQLLGKALVTEPPATVREGHIFAEGYNEELDKLHAVVNSGKSWIVALEQKERERTGIKNLKIGYNNVFGYYILLSKGQLQKAPSDYIRKQTIAGGERYVTPELKEKEELLLNAEERMNELEYTLYMELLGQLQRDGVLLQELAAGIAQLDVLLTLATCAREHRYTKPVITTDGQLALTEARHPVVERLEQHYIPNSITMSPEERTIIITGPNMSGKSTFMRSVALIQLLAQIGSFVPCTSARVSVVDRIFSRIGAYDDLFHGQSTFMVEMSETAIILHNATQHSLVLLDELGRGTSTFDGIALAQAVASYIHQTVQAKTLFATHYHLLNTLEDSLKGVRNFHMLIKENKEEIIFLRQLVQGGTDKSYGIQVARLAGVPAPVLDIAKSVMKNLELREKNERKREDKNLSSFF